MNYDQNDKQYELTYKFKFYFNDSVLTIVTNVWYGDWHGTGWDEDITEIIKIELVSHNTT